METLWWPGLGLPQPGRHRHLLHAARRLAWKSCFLCGGRSGAMPRTTPVALHARRANVCATPASRRTQLHAALLSLGSVEEVVEPLPVLRGSCSSTESSSSVLLEADVAPQGTGPPPSGPAEPYGHSVTSPTVCGRALRTRRGPTDARRRHLADAADAAEPYRRSVTSPTVCGACGTWLTQSSRPVAVMFTYVCNWVRPVVDQSATLRRVCKGVAVANQGWARPAAVR